VVLVAGCIRGRAVDRIERLIASAVLVFGLAFSLAPKIARAYTCPAGSQCQPATATQSGTGTPKVQMFRYCQGGQNVPPCTGYSYSSINASGQAACDAMRAAQVAGGTTGGWLFTTHVANTAFPIYCNVANGAGQYNWGWVTTGDTGSCPSGTVEGAGGLCYSTAYTCPANATPAWTLVMGVPESDSYCKRPDRTCPAAGATFSGESGAGPRSSAFVGGVPVFCASDGCAYNAAGTFQPFGQTMQLVAPYVSRGEACGNGYPALGASGPSATGTAEQSGCGPGLVKGTINGTTLCVAQGAGQSVKVTSSSTTTNNADGTSTVTTTTKTYTTTTDENGNQTTKVDTAVTTKKYSGPNGTGTEQGTDTKAGTEEGGTFCQENPDHRDCKPTSFGGACGSEFKCDGDAVQCAIAKEQHRRNCVLDNTGEFTTGGAQTEFDDARKFDAKQLNAAPQAFPGVTSDTFLAAGGCLDDHVEYILGQEVRIPFSSLCPYLQAAGLAFLAVCGVLSFRIVSKGAGV